MGEDGRQEWKRAQPWAAPTVLSVETLPPLLGAVMAETLLYGIHVVLFFACVYFLVVRHLRLQWLMLSGVVAMFFLTTGDIGFTFFVATQQTKVLYIGTTGTFLREVFPKFTIYVTNNLISSLLMVARFYVVWGQKWYLLVGTLIPLLAATGLGYACRISDPQMIRKLAPPFLLINLVLSNAVTLLTAGRIWWLARRASTLGEGRGRQYRLTSVIIVESGVLYSLSMLVLIALSKTQWSSIAACIMLRTVAIVPVLMFVQIAIGHAPPPRATRCHDSDKAHDISTACAESRPRTSNMLDTVVRTTMHSGGSSTFDLTSHASTMAGHTLELQRRGHEPMRGDQQP